ncbi:hypothetical protein NP233_g4547 [Leucocoprinus birnbaumii]|uniref:Uncharacterized protein n=1 Tax=Leucocoprinus birnbaumii TaxID=56174 RepID=A0AAD5YSQ5_9AGAR|nr:hypothetical protein NP233_g4547 [Leucocoprinus birnbaumii]
MIPTSFSPTPANPNDVLSSVGLTEPNPEHETPLRIISSSANLAIEHFLYKHKLDSETQRLEFPNLVIRSLSQRKRPTHQRGISHEFVIATLYASPTNFYRGTGRVQILLDRDANYRDPLHLRGPPSIVARCSHVVNAHDVVKIAGIAEHIENSYEISRIVFPIYSDIRACFSLSNLMVLITQVRLSLERYDPFKEKCSYFAATVMRAASQITRLPLERTPVTEDTSKLKPLSNFACHYDAVPHEDISSNKFWKEFVRSYHDRYSRFSRTVSPPTRVMTAAASHWTLYLTGGNRRQPEVN